jgi:hypothetical protein
MLSGKFLNGMENEIPLDIEILLKSTDVSLPNETLLQSILARKSDLATFLNEKEPDVKIKEINPKPGFPILEVIALVILVDFLRSAAKELGKETAREAVEQARKQAKKRARKRSREWLVREFPDIHVEDEPDEDDEDESGGSDGGEDQG